MNVYRFEFPNGEGIIRGTSTYNCEKYIYNEQDRFYIDELKNMFERYLLVPDCFDFPNDYGDKVSYFTDYGYQKFKKYIDALIEIFKEFGIRIRMISVSDNCIFYNVAYRDMFQVIYERSSTTIEKHD